MERKGGEGSGGGGGGDSDPSDLVVDKRKKRKIEKKKKTKRNRDRATRPGSDHCWSRSPSHGGEGRSRSPELGGRRSDGFRDLGFSGLLWKVPELERERYLFCSFP